MNYEESLHKMIFNVGYESSETGFNAELSYLLTQRDIKPNLPPSEWNKHSSPLFTDWMIHSTFRRSPDNYRLALLLGYQFDWGEIQVGTGYDVDGDLGYYDTPHRFDGGFGKFNIDL